MDQYYTRPCNFYFGKNSISKISKGKALPLHANKLISFDSLEISNRKRSKALEGLEKTLSNEQTLSSVGSLAAAAVHELGTPLATISLVSGELKKQLLTKIKEINEIISN